MREGAATRVEATGNTGRNHGRTGANTRRRRQPGSNVSTAVTRHRRDRKRTSARRREAAGKHMPTHPVCQWRSGRDQVTGKCRIGRGQQEKRSARAQGPKGWLAAASRSKHPQYHDKNTCRRRPGRRRICARGGIRALERWRVCVFVLCFCSHPTRREGGVRRPSPMLALRAAKGDRKAPINPQRKRGM